MSKRPIPRNERLEAALDNAERGWPVLPLHSIRERHCSCGRDNCTNPGKHPRTAHGVKDATTEEGQIRRWWGEWPDANVGIATGSKSGLVVLDVDPRNGGDDSLAKLKEQYSPLPRTLECLTGGGGRHLYFQHPDGPVKNAVDGLGRGLDIKSDGGYVVAPPSSHISGGSYRWNTSGRPGQVPEWMLAKLRERRPLPQRQRGGTGSEVIPKGSRNTQLTSDAGAMRRRGMGEEAILAALLEENRRRCRPPLPEDEVEGIARSVARYPPARTAPTTAPDGPDEGPRGHAGARSAQGNQSAGGRSEQSTTELLVKIAEEAELFHDSSDIAYAQVRDGIRSECMIVNSKPFRLYLRRAFRQRHGRVTGKVALDNAIEEATATACRDGAESPVCIRVAGVDNEIFLDLADQQRRIVRITPEGWDVSSCDPPVRFIRPVGTLPLPAPSQACNIAELKGFLNVPDQGNFVLIISWLIATLRPTGPYPVLCFYGEHGSAKTTAAKLLRRLIDPRSALLRSLPNSELDLMISASTNWILGYDNVSYLRPAMSDAMCRLSTGGALGTRKFYTNRDEVLFEGQRPIILNGIGELATRSDLVDRTIFISMPPIPPGSRRREKDLTTAFDERLPSLLAALLDAVSSGLRPENKVPIPDLPRMADYMDWVTGCEPGLGWPRGTFLDAYERNRGQANDIAIEASPVAAAVRNLMAGENRWEGTAASLLVKLEQQVGEGLTRLKSWPKTPHALSWALRRVAPNLRQVGIDLSFDFRTSDSKRERLIIIERKDQ